MVTTDEIPDPQALTVRTYLNNLEGCKAHTSEMLFTIRQFIASLSRVFPLEPGDVLATGSPPGPGMYHDPPILAKVGDVMRIEIEKIGVLKTGRRRDAVMLSAGAGDVGHRGRAENICS
jgi:2-keto-4-pentenoate hydratase/2-oxohepta-3-ene-1,7-dioic acid hydratase in catechol pathway